MKLHRTTVVLDLGARLHEVHLHHEIPEVLKNISSLIIGEIHARWKTVGLAGGVAFIAGADFDLDVLEDFGVGAPLDVLGFVELDAEGSSLEGGGGLAFESGGVDGEVATVREGETFSRDGGFLGGDALPGAEGAGLGH